MRGTALQKKGRREMGTQSLFCHVGRAKRRVSTKLPLPDTGIGIPLEQEAEENGGVQQVLADQFAKVYKVSLQVAA
jgi:hypothetical protein